MKPYYTNLDIVKMNNNYRELLYNVPRGIQLVAVSLGPEEETGEELHPDTTHIQVVKGRALTVVGDTRLAAIPGSIIIVPPGIKYNVINISRKRDLKLLTIYNPPKHPKKKVQKK